MFFMLRVTPAQWWVLILGIETKNSASCPVREATGTSFPCNSLVAVSEPVHPD